MNKALSDFVESLTPEQRRIFAYNNRQPRRYQDRNRYRVHQGAKECMRRRNQ